MDEVERRTLVQWAHSYNGYKRLGGELASVLQPLLDPIESTGRVPAWAGVDLLRGLAFFLTRAAAHGESPEDVLHDPRFWAVVDAVRNHPDARPRDLPPLNGDL